MVCQKLFNYLRKLPWIALHAGCFVAFIVQMSILANNKISPTETVSHFEEKILDDIEFPVLFKICIKPSFDLEELKKAGYESIWKYFIGQSRHNQSLYGWAGHTEDGNITGSVKGWYCISKNI